MILIILINVFRKYYPTLNLFQILNNMKMKIFIMKYYTEHLDICIIYYIYNKIQKKVQLMSNLNNWKDIYAKYLIQQQEMAINNNLLNNKMSIGLFTSFMIQNIWEELTVYLEYYIYQWLLQKIINKNQIMLAIILKNLLYIVYSFRDKMEIFILICVFQLMSLQFNFVMVLQELFYLYYLEINCFQNKAQNKELYQLDKIYGVKELIKKDMGCAMEYLETVMHFQLCLRILKIYNGFIMLINLFKFKKIKTL
ncbi:hypothetical protein IMG5_155540 [Ichthyophthirius multifiliis]|uniref:Transmembrane protein n=1 Tax=Ichthyophthirius multifiliis TaxID=5932 RepID=G0QZA7_ICHMU|nr:hypothetical protein IMG5_155540 [Ichthyophthirius multifiliis]EGR29447.1 hypothetical protein IMG5_155540 [Ichthyophthirius multifiliis]|eukprot:XP_004030683.1 hypothetical protein IMG5_155540 [Ichthyophthirius multifiliis]